MNQTQQKYLRTRAEAILKSRDAELRKKHTTPAKILTDEEKHDALRSGNFTIKPDAANRRYGWANAIDFGETFQVFDTTTYNAEHMALQTQFTKLMDNVFLGSDEDALAALREFEAL